MQAHPQGNIPSEEPHTADDSPDTLTYFATPHDKILSALHGRTQQERSNLADDFSFPSAEVGDDTASPPADRGHSSTLTGFMRSTPLRPSGVLSPTSFTPLSQDTAAPLTDPYDGTALGILVPSLSFPADHQTATSQASGENMGGSAKELPRNEELWAHLSQITNLQTEIARMHLELEGVGIGKGKGKGKVGENKDRGGRKPSEGGRQSQSDAGPEEYDVEGEGIEMDDEETERNRTREEEFAKLTDQFEGRKESVNDIMSKLDDLSKALAEFHALQAPEVRMPSPRNDSSGVRDTTPPGLHKSPTSPWSKGGASTLAPPVNLAGSLSRKEGQES